VAIGKRKDFLFFYSAHPTINDDLPNRIACGTIRVKRNIVEFLENGVRFADDSIASDVDEVGEGGELHLIKGPSLIRNDSQLSNIVLPQVSLRIFPPPPNG
jgi:dimethylaniline monooxygenase (N-oxide forming)